MCECAFIGTLGESRTEHVVDIEERTDDLMGNLRKLEPWTILR